MLEPGPGRGEEEKASGGGVWPELLCTNWLLLLQLAAATTCRGGAGPVMH